MPKIILVSHSKEIASGTKSLLKQMAGDVDIIPIGGLPDGSIGTSFDIIQEVLTKLEDDALCFYDIGSSEMNVDMAIEKSKLLGKVVVTMSETFKATYFQRIFLYLLL